jgi:hypothetical protein
MHEQRDGLGNPYTGRKIKPWITQSAYKQFKAYYQAETSTRIHIQKKNRIQISHKFHNRFVKIIENISTFWEN